MSNKSIRTFFVAAIISVAAASFPHSASSSTIRTKNTIHTQLAYVEESPDWYWDPNDFPDEDDEGGFGEYGPPGAWGSTPAPVSQPLMPIPLVPVPPPFPISA